MACQLTVPLQMLIKGGVAIFTIVGFQHQIIIRCQLTQIINLALLTLGKNANNVMIRYQDVVPQ